MIKLNEYDKKLNCETLKCNLSSSKFSSSVSIALLLSKNGVTQKVTSEPVKRKIYNQHKNLRNSSRNSKSKPKQRTCSLDREALDRFKYFKSLCAIKPPPNGTTLKDETAKANASENLRKYFEDLSNHELLPYNKHLFEENNKNYKKAVNKTEFALDYKVNKNNENYFRRSSCSELNLMEKSVSDESTTSFTDSTDSQLNLLKVSQNRIRNIEIKFEKPSENHNNNNNRIEKENNSKKENGLQKMKSEKFKFPKIVLPEKEEIIFSESEEDEDLDDFLFFGKKESKNNCQYQGLTRQNRMMFFDSTHEKKKPTKVVKQVELNSSSNNTNNDYIANLPSLPKNSQTNIKKSPILIENDEEDINRNDNNSKYNKQNTNSANIRHLKLETLSVITEEDSDSYFSLVSPVQLASDSTANMSSNSQIFNQQELFIVEVPPLKSKTQKILQKEDKQPTLTQISTIHKNVSAFIKSKMSIFEVEKINSQNKINNNFNLKINFNNSSKYRLKNINEEKVKNM